MTAWQPTTAARSAVVVRIPYWMACAERTDLADLLATVLTSTRVLPPLQVDLESVLVELGVAEARDQVWPARADRVRAASGLARDVLPVRMSPREIEAVLSLPGLPAAVRAALHHPAGQG